MMIGEVKNTWKGSGCSVIESFFWTSFEWTQEEKQALDSSQIRTRHFRMFKARAVD